MKVRVLLAGFLGVVMVAAACAPKATPAPTPVAPAPTPAAPAPGAPRPAPTPVAPAPAPVAAVKPTGELRIAMSYLGVEVMDPSQGPASGVKNYVPMYDYLVGATPDLRFSKELGLARDWEVSHGPNSSTYTFYLRQGIKFQNGDEVTAEDVKFSIEYFMRETSVSSASSVLRAKIDRIEVPERYKVVVHTKTPYPFLTVDLSRLGYQEGMVLPSKYIREVGEEYFNRNPIGSGPYRFKEQVIGSYMRFEATGEEHWLYGVPKYKTVTFFLVPEETTRIAMLQTGQADIIDVSRERAKEVTAAGFNTFLKPGSRVVMMWLGNQWQTDTYLNDKRVREALNLAINREEILEFIFEGQGKIVGDTYYGSFALGYKALPTYPYDPERARSLLQEAFPGGVELTINSFNRPGVPELQRMNEAVAGFWEKVGIKTKILPMEYGTNRAMFKKGTARNIAAGFATSNRLIWTGAWRIIHHSKGMLTMTKRPDLDALIEGVEAEIDLDKVAQRQWETARFMRENHLIVSMLETGGLYAANPKKVTQWDLGKLIFDDNFLDLIQLRGPKPPAGR